MAQPCHWGHGPCHVSDFGGDIFLSHISYFHPESAPNPLSFAPRLFLQIFVREIYLFAIEVK